LAQMYGFSEYKDAHTFQIRYVAMLSKYQPLITCRTVCGATMQCLETAELVMYR